MQKQQVFYIHGGESFENYNDYLDRLRSIPLWHIPTEYNIGSAKKWTSGLEEDLGEGYQVFLPPMPNKQNAKFVEWSIWFERHFDYLRDGAILMGCSLGAMFLAKYLSEYDLPFRPKAVFLMAGAYKLPDFNDKDCGDFLVEPERASVISEKSENVIIMHSSDDPVVDIRHGNALSKSLPKAEFITFQDKNHFLIEEFPELLDKIRYFAKN